MEKGNMLRIENEIISRFETTLGLMDVLKKIMTNDGVNGTESFYVGIDRKPMTLTFYYWQYLCKVALVLKEDIEVEEFGIETEDNSYSHYLFFYHDGKRFEVLVTESELEEYRKLYPVDDYDDSEKEGDEDDT